MDTQENKFKKVTSFIESNDENIKQQLMFSGILLMIFEQFKKFSVSILEDLFSDGWKVKKDRIIHGRGSKFEKIVDEFGKGKSGQEESKVFRASLHWLNSLDAITEDELSEVKRLLLIRNDIGHELFNIFMNDKKDFIKIEDIIFVLDVYSKVTKWWFKEIEATAHPDLVEEYDSINFESFETFEMALLRRIIFRCL